MGVWKRVKSAIAATWRCAEKRDDDEVPCPSWPVCGCDPQANSVVEALQKKGMIRDGRFVIERDEWQRRDEAPAP